MKSTKEVPSASKLIWNENGIYRRQIQEQERAQICLKADVVWAWSLQKADKEQERALIWLKAYFEKELGLQKANKVQKRAPICMKAYLGWERGLQKAYEEH